MKEPVVAYIMSRFPKITETFVLYEILAMREQGVRVEIFPLLRERQPVSHPEAEALVREAHYQPFLSWKILRANAHFLLRRPRRYLGALLSCLRAAWGSWNYWGGTLAIFPQVALHARRMEELGVGHVHAHFVNHPATAALIVRRLTGIPFSFTAHGADLHCETRMLPLKMRECAWALTVSDYNLEFLVRECGEALRPKITVHRCGVDLREFQPRPPHCNDGPVRLLCVGSLEEVKGHRTLIEACRLLTERGLDWRCDLVGDGPLRAELGEAIESAGLAGRMRLLGTQPRPRVRELLQQADVAVLPSVLTAEGKREGIPVALMEALACRVPVVSSRLSGIPELVVHEETGLLAEPRDGRGLAEQLARLAASPELRQRLGEAGRRLVGLQFDLEKNARRLAQRFSAQSRAGRPEVGAGEALQAATESTV